VVSSVILFLSIQHFAHSQCTVATAPVFEFSSYEACAGDEVVSIFIETGLIGDAYN